MQRKGHLDGEFVLDVGIGSLNWSSFMEGGNFICLLMNW